MAGVINMRPVFSAVSGLRLARLTPCGDVPVAGGFDRLGMVMMTNLLVIMVSRMSWFFLHGEFPFYVQSSEFRVQGSGFRVQGSEFLTGNSELGTGNSELGTGN